MPFLLCGLACVVVVVVSVCQRPDRAGRDEAIPGVAAGKEQWVDASYRAPDEELAALMDQMLPIEIAADQALQDAGAGAIDGNEVGAGAYDLYFAGGDPEEMWRVLEPILRDVPRTWDRAELRTSLDDEHPTVLTPRG